METRKEILSHLDPKIVRENKLGQKYVVIEGLTRASGKHKTYAIKFISTGFETFTTLFNIKNGRVKDFSLVSKISDFVGIEQISNQGCKFFAFDEALPESPYGCRHKYYKVVFESGNIVYARIEDIEKGRISDNFNPVIAGVGMIGLGSKKGNEQIYDLWRNMIRRCHNPKNADYGRYGGKGITVHKRWHRFDLFMEDIKTLEGFDFNKFKAGEIQLDKDKLQMHLPHSERVYSATTCVWLAPSENNLYVVRTKKQKQGL